MTLHLDVSLHKDPGNQPATPAPTVALYDATYQRLEEPIYREIRRETWDEDIGQNGWITATEQDHLLSWLSLSPGRRLLDVACGSGGPTLRITERTRASVVGIDVHSDGIAAASRQAAVRGLQEYASFQLVDADGALPFGDASFDALICVDAINHFRDRPRVLSDWARVLRPGGRLVFTDPIVVTGPLTSEEIAIRSSIGFFLFVAPGNNDRMLADAGLNPLAREDRTAAVADAAARWHAARLARAAELRRIEGDATFEGQQRFLSVAAHTAREGRLSRFAYAASKAG